ncbi:MAG: 2-succinyl-6-hydroxy-2,4-cyclohexadiene-1-carboxylate synthase [Verrucomicrobiales bacterium]|nr:2-succinyl-6-hydroxy-2,4-cyclohexadiene-1-carboxylate synthase [Verrucomicrobiales bacterium]
MLKFKTRINNNNKQWITFIHGFGGSSNIWHKQVRELSKNHNLLFIDLRGHGKSRNIPMDSDFNLFTACEDIIHVLKFLKIKSSHFVGISFGSLLIFKLIETHKEYINKSILAGAITSFNHFTRFLLLCLNLLKGFLPNMLLYKLFAYIIMPKSNHKESRRIFIQEAKLLDRKVFKQWLKLIPDLKKYIHHLKPLNFNKYILFLSGKDDYLFSDEVKEFASKNTLLSYCSIEGAGHVVNIDNPSIFNQRVIEYLK